MQRNTKRQWPFTKMITESGSMKTHLPPPIPSAKWYHSIETLPLSKFIDAAADDNLRALIIEGNPTDLQLKEAWSIICQEYADASGDMAHKHYLKAWIEIIQVSVKLETIEGMIDVLSVAYYKPFADRLNKLLRTSYPLDYTKPDQYKKELKACFMRSRGIKIDLDLKTIRFEELNKKKAATGDNKKPTRAYFYSYLITLSNHAGYQVNDQITTFEFCERVRRLNKEIDAQKPGKK
jgi:hypothetical protein